MAIHFPLLINAPKTIPVTKEQHSQFSVIGIASFMISYPVAIEKTDTHINIFLREDKAWSYSDNYRFQDPSIKKWGYSSIEMKEFQVPIDLPLAQTIIKYFPHLFFKDSL